MDEEKSIRTLTEELCYKMIEYGLQPHSAWTQYNAVYIPLVYYFQDRNVDHFDEGILSDYRKMLLERFQKEELSEKWYHEKLRGASRFQEFCMTGDVAHVGRTGHSKKPLYAHNEAVLQGFLKYISNEVAPKTASDMESFLRFYLVWTEQEGINDILNSTAHSFAGYLSYAAKKYSDGTIHNIQLTLKKFYAFLKEAKGLDIPYDFVLSMPVSRTKRVFAPLSHDEISRIFAQIDRSTIKGKRDFAILLLSARNGLRGIDILNLELTDINWRKKEIRLTQRKTGEPLTTPLLDDVGAAIKDYILNGRPDSIHKKVFLRISHPHSPFKKTIVLSHIIKTYQKQAGIERIAHDGKGFHSLRRALGTAMSENEIPINTISQVLGHADANSAKQYISVNYAQLKSCALDFAGIEPRG